MREGREISWGRGGFFRTPVYRAVLSSQVGVDSRFRKSREDEDRSNDLLVKGVYTESVSSCDPLWVSQPQLDSRNFKTHSFSLSIGQNP